LTIAISIKTNDGVVLASDSASTVIGAGQDGKLGVVNVYNNANKIFNLCKGLPIGAITWGAGSIGQASVSTIVKDFRRALSSKDSKHQAWKLVPVPQNESPKYTVEQVAGWLKEFVFDELYSNAFPESAPLRPDLGFIVAGYSSSDAALAEEFQVEMRAGKCIGPVPLRAKHEIGLTAGGETEALNRLMTGVAGGLSQVLQNLFKVPEAQTEKALAVIRQQLTVPLVIPAMPLQDAIDLGEFLVDLTIKFSRFKPGAPTVGGPIDIASISKHEGFRWIRRKYYFDRLLNPDEEITRTFRSESKEF
jgi:hypothetical protein